MAQYTFSYKRDPGSIGWDTTVTTEAEVADAVMLAFCNFLRGCSYDESTISNLVPDYANLEL